MTEAPVIHAHVQISDTAHVSDYAKLGEGVTIWDDAQVREWAHIGAGCIIGKGAYIDKGVSIGKRCKIENGAQVFHGVSLEDGVFVGPGAIFCNDRRPRAVNPDGTLKTADDWQVDETVILQGASIGAGAVILPGIIVGCWAMIGAGSVVTHNVLAYEVWYGNPAEFQGYTCKCGGKLSSDLAAKCPRCGE